MRNRFRRVERGEDESFEFTTLIIPLMIMISLIAFATIVRSKMMPAWSAASECARAAIATRSETLGRQQATHAALGMLAGNFVDPATAKVEITGNWAPDSPISCSISYDIDVSGIPGFAELTGGSVKVSGAVTLRTEPFKSRWQ